MRFTAVIITMVIIYIATSNNQIQAAPIPDDKPPAPESKSILPPGATKVDLASILGSTGSTPEGTRVLGNFNVGI